MSITITLASRIWAACADETSRFAISAVRIIPDRDSEALAVATNGRILAISTATTAGALAESIMIPKLLVEQFEQFDEENKAQQRYDDDIGYIGGPPPVQYAVQVSDGQCSIRDPERGTTISLGADAGKFPDWENVIPDLTSPEYADAHYICLNAELLLAMQEALGCNAERRGLGLYFPKNPAKPVAVVGPEGIGAIMPINSERNIDSAVYTDLRTRCLATTGGAS